MRRPVLTLFFHFNPWGACIGGIETSIRNFVKYCAGEFDLRIVGTTDTRDRRLLTWHDAELMGRTIRFMPLFIQNDDNIKPLVPNTVRYTAALLRLDLASDFMHFHRLEPSLAAWRWAGEKTLYVHIDIGGEMYTQSSRNEALWRFFPTGYFLLERLLVRRFQHILACNRNSVHLYRARYPDIANRVHYVRNTVDTAVHFALDERCLREARQALGQRLGVAECTRFILFAGRLQPQKDPLLLVRSFAGLDDPTAHLIVCGDGNLRNEMRAETARLGLSGRVTMMGAVEHDALAKLQQLCHVLLLTSSYEGLPLVALESLACGMPVVTTPCGDTPHILTQQTGVVSDDHSAEAVTTALRRVLDRLEDFPRASCAAAAQAFAAGPVVGEMCQAMLQRWEFRKWPAGAVNGSCS